MNRRYVILTALCLTLAGTLLTALGAEDIRARADRVSGQVKGKGPNVVVLEGNVTVNHGETLIWADRAVYDKDAGSLEFTGHVRLENEGIVVKAEELMYLRRTKEGTFRRAVSLSREEEKDDSGKVTKDAFSLSADELVFAAEKENFTARGGVSLTHKDFTATAGEVSYDDEHQELTLRGQPLLNHKDETIKADEIVIAVEADTFRILKAEITFIVEETEEQEKTESPEPAPTVAPDDGNRPPAT